MHTRVKKRHRILGDFAKKTNPYSWRTLVCEVLEDRVVLATLPVIAEFQALNASTIADEDGEFSDWVEIQNPSVELLNLEGFYLTDSANDLTRWQLPSVSVDPRDELLIYASGKDKTDPASELHTNFRLSSDGEYLALVAPDGKTIVHEFSPGYPVQVEDQSYGLAFNREVTNLIGEQYPVAALVPSNDLLGQSWTELGFDDATWQNGTSAVGYEVLAEGFTVRDEFDSLSDEWTVDVPEGGASTVSIQNGSLRIVAPVGQDTGGEVGRGLAPLVVRDVPNDALSYEIITHVQKADSGNAGIVVYDAATDKPGLVFDYNLNLQFRMMNPEGDTLGTATSFGANSFFMRLTRDGLTGAWSGYFKVNEADEWTLVTTVFDDIGLPALQQPQIGVLANTPTHPVTADFDFFEINVADEYPVYGPETEFNLESVMHETNSSVYLRMPFDLNEDPSMFDEMAMAVQYDDGFIAYLNGTQITAQNVPVDQTWNSAASGAFGAVNGSIPTQQIDVSESVSLLQPGENVLAIHAMNVGASDPDFFFNISSLDATEISSSEQFFATPSPGELNGLPAAPTPQILNESGAFFGSTTVDIVIEDTQLEVRYTLDGNEPTLNSSRYAEPIVLTSSAMLQARAFDTSSDQSYAPSNPASGTYVILDEDLKNRSSDLPIVILDSLGQSLPSSGTTTLRPVNVLIIDIDRTTGRATIENADIDYLGRGGVRDRGSSSSGLPKPNLTFETWGENGTNQDDDDDTGILGMAPDSDWVFYAGTSYDPTLIHNQFAFDMSNQIGQWAPDYVNVEVYFNRNDGTVSEADYHGVYAIHEKVTQGSHRVDVEEIDPSVTKTPEEAAAGEPNISGGYIWKIDRADPGEPTFRAGGQTMNWVYPKDPGSRKADDDQKATQQQEDWVVEYFDAFASTLANPDINDPDGYSKYIDVESWVETHLLNVLFFNVDALRLSAYLHKNQDGKIVYGPVWDFDRALNSTDGRDSNPFVWRATSGDLGTDFFGNGTQSWWGDLFSDPGFWQYYVDTWQELRLNEFSNQNLGETIDRIADGIRESQAREQANCTVCRQIVERGGWESEIAAMKSWLFDRAGFIDSNFADPTVVRIDGVEQDPAASGFEVTAEQQVEFVPAPIAINNDSPLVSGENGAVDATFFVPTNDDLGTSWTALNFDDTDWTPGKLGVGYGTSTGFEQNYTTVIEPRSVDSDATNILMRIPFSVESLDDFEKLVLQMKYDDGFVVYLNGETLFEHNLREEPAWNSRASSHSNSKAVVFEDFDITKHVDKLQIGENLLAIQGINSSASSSDMLFQAALVQRTITFEPNPTGTVYYTLDGTDPRAPDGSVSPSAIEAKPGEYLNVDSNTQVIARNFDSTDRGSQAEIVLTDWGGPLTINLIIDQPELAITEINYNPQAPTEIELLTNPLWENESFEFIEIQNVGDSPADLTGVKFTDGVEFEFGNNDGTTLSPGDYVLVVSNKEAFQKRYGSNLPIVGEYLGNLNNNGEVLALQNGTGETIFSVRFGDNDPWPLRTDGVGATLELLNVHTPTDEQGKYYSWRGSHEYGGSPGRDGQTPTGIVINEIMSNTEQLEDESDSVELYNSSDKSIDVSGWYLSDTSSDLLKFAIPDGTVLGPGDYLVLTEQDFNQGENGFALSSFGDDVWLVQVDEQKQVVAFVDDVHFGGSSVGESLGRVTGGGHRLARLKSTTLGGLNSEPSIGPLVITEINYHPAAPEDSALGLYPGMLASDLEFVEIHNPTGVDIDLTNWQLRGGVSFDFEDGTIIPSMATLAVLSFDVDDPENSFRLEAFRSQYQAQDAVLLGGFSGQLGNGDDVIQLLQPDPLAGSVQDLRFLADEVLYDDLSPWPTLADGEGVSLQRIEASAVGNAASSWHAISPSPGTALFDEVAIGDFDGNGVVDAIDINLLFEQFASANPELTFDVNQDGLVNGADSDLLVHDIIGTVYGDANLDGQFNSGDLVSLFQAGQYEDEIPSNSKWETGDWNGDGEFSTSDLVLAFQDGGYSIQSVAAVGTNVAARDKTSMITQTVITTDDTPNDPAAPNRPAVLNLTARDELFAGSSKNWNVFEDETEMDDGLSLDDM